MIVCQKERKGHGHNTHDLWPSGDGEWGQQTPLPGPFEGELGIGYDGLSGIW